MKKITTTLLLSLALNGVTQAASTDGPRPSAPDGEVTGHGYVDLGLPSGTLWATGNIGAESLFYPGECFAWGETQTRNNFQWRLYEFFQEEYTDEQGNVTYSATDIGQQISRTEYDAARTQWGEAWRMPAKEDWEELLEYCTAEYKDNAAIPPRKGLLFTGPNGNSILLPPTEDYNGINPGLPRGGDYWTATAASDLTENPCPTAMMTAFSAGSSQMKLKSDSRHLGCAIRPVINRQDISTPVAAITNDATSMTYENGTLTVNGHAQAYRLTIADLSGRRVLDSPITDGECRLPYLSKGIYLATLHNAGKTVKTLKISVK